MSFREEAEDSATLASEILMDSNITILVEGEADILLYEKFFDVSTCRLHQLQGKKRIIDTIDIINERKKANSAFGIIDADLDYIIKQKYADNIFITDGHDAEIMMFMSDKFHLVIKEFYKQEYCKNILASNEVRKKLIELELPIAYLRLLSLKEKYNFAFYILEGDETKYFPFGKIIEVNNHIIQYTDHAKLVKTICCFNRNQGQAFSQTEIIDKLTQLKATPYDDKYILHGHDIMHLMALALKHYGKKAKLKKTADDFETAFRLAYSLNDFKETSLYQSLKQYSNRKGINFFVK